ncbi:hypothetical protein [Kocuria sp. KH4]
MPRTDRPFQIGDPEMASRTERIPPAPPHLGGAGRKLWRSVVTEFYFPAHDLAVLEEACRVRDRIAGLEEAVNNDGLMIPSSQGSRLHPAIGEQRQQRLALARLLATLGVLGVDDEGQDLPPSNGVRGVYTPGA